MKDQNEKTGEHTEGQGLGISRRELMLLGGATAAAFMGASVPTAFGATEAAPRVTAPIDILFTIYPNGTLLDFAGPNEVFARIPNVKIRFASPTGGPVTLENGVVFGKTERLADVVRTDVLCVPGGPDISSMRAPEVLGNIRRLAEGARYVTSVCTGSLILGASGVLKGKRSACHWACLNLLKECGAIPDPARIVKDGRFMSGGGVTSGIDFALAVAAELAGPLNAQVAQLLVEYNPAPPFHSGHPSTAPRDVLDIVLQRLPGAGQGLLQVG